MNYRIGLPMWGHKQWIASFFSQDASSADFLAQYATVFNTVEGNTTFYAIPSESSVAAWNEATPSDFRFSFKMPKMITHDLKLQRCDLSVKTFFQHIEPLQEKIGPVMIQLPPSFHAEHLTILERFIKTLPAAYHYSVELRHEDFFDTAEHELAVNDLLAKFHIDRVCFDSRGLFASHDTESETLDAQQKKPRLPVHANALAKNPVIRFIGHTSIEENQRYFQNWIPKIREWLAEGREPYLLVHMANNAYAPQLALFLSQMLTEQIESINQLPVWPCEKQDRNGQIGLF